MEVGIVTHIERRIHRVGREGCRQIGTIGIGEVEIPRRPGDEIQRVGDVELDLLVRQHRDRHLAVAGDRGVHQTIITALVFDVAETDHDICQVVGQRDRERETV